MPRRVEPRSELAFQAAKARARSYLLADGNGPALRIQPNGTKTWLFRYRPIAIAVARQTASRVS